MVKSDGIMIVYRGKENTNAISVKTKDAAIAEVLDATKPLFDLNGERCFSRDLRCNWHAMVYAARSIAREELHKAVFHKVFLMGSLCVHDHVDVDSLRPLLSQFCACVRPVVHVFAPIGVYEDGGRGFAKAVTDKLQPSRLSRGRLPRKRFNYEKELERFNQMTTDQMLKCLKDHNVVSQKRLSRLKTRKCILDELMQVTEESLNPSVQGMRFLHPSIIELDSYVSENDKLNGLHIVSCFAIEVGKQQTRIKRLMNRWKRVTPLAGKIAIFVRGVFTEVQFRPCNSGYLNCKRSFECAIQSCTTDPQSLSKQSRN